MIGYSGTPLAKKLSLKDAMRVWWDGMPDSICDEIVAEGLQLQLLNRPEAPIDAARISSSPSEPTSQRSLSSYCRSSPLPA